jgi:hypothetical protein
MLVVMATMLVVAAATFAALESGTRAQARDQAFAQEVSDSEATFQRLQRDLRQATFFLSPVKPNSISFQMVQNGTSYNIAYDCTATDSLGSQFTRCAETQAVAPNPAPAPAATAGSLDIQHVSNGGVSTFCKADGSGPSGSVFFVSNPSIPNTDGSTMACDEAYELQIASLSGGPTFVKARVQITAGGSLATGGLTHQTVLQTGIFLPNLDAGS